MILAAGRGERMRPLTNSIPKPLLKVGSHTLIEHQIINLARSGFTDIVINHAYLGEMIEQALGTGERYGVKIRYSPEKTVLETAGGVINAMSMLCGSDHNVPFLVVNADIYCKVDYAHLLSVFEMMHIPTPEHWAHLILVDNPVHHPQGDFALKKKEVMLAGDRMLTFSGIGVYHPRLFDNLQPVRMKLAPLLHQAIEGGRVTGEFFSGTWIDVGTPERLHWLDDQSRNHTLE